jgi:hypothetical protein
VPAGVTRNLRPGQPASAKSRRPVSTASRNALEIAVSVSRTGIATSCGASMGLHRGFNNEGRHATAWDGIMPGLYKKCKLALRKITT